MPTLYTVTSNLLAETTTYYPKVQWSETQRATRETFQVGGKGINVAMAADRLGMESCALFFPGGYTGQRCRAWLDAEGVTCHPIEMEEETRAGWVVRTSGKAETTFLGADRPMPLSIWKQAMDYLRDHLRPGDGLVFAGSIPGWSEAHAAVLKQLLKSKAQDVFLALDTYGPPLKDLYHLPWDLVKINQTEFDTLFEGQSLWQRIPRRLAEMDGRYGTRWVITAGSDAVYARDSDGKLYEAHPPSVREVSPVGCGDIVTATISVRIIQGDPFPDALRGALAYAAESARSAKPVDFDPVEIEPLPESSVQILKNLV